jgi:hypothetical protein
MAFSSFSHARRVFPTGACCRFDSSRSPSISEAYGYWGPNALTDSSYSCLGSVRLRRIPRRGPPGSPGRVYDALGLLVASGTDVQGDGTEGGWTVNLALTEDETDSRTARAVDEHGLAGGWAAEESFLLSTVNAPPLGTMFPEPDDGASIVSTSPDLVVSEGEDPEGATLVYEFEVDLLPSFDSGDLVTGTVPASGTGQVVWEPAAAGIELTNNSWVYARVRPVDEGNVASVPDTISFFVRGDNDAPNVPVLIAPENESVGGNPPTFEVEDPTDPEGDMVFVEFIVARVGRALELHRGRRSVERRRRRLGRKL